MSEKGKSFWFFFLKQAVVVWREPGVTLNCKQTSLAEPLAKVNFLSLSLSLIKRMVLSILLCRLRPVSCTPGGLKGRGEGLMH